MMLAFLSPASSVCLFVENMHIFANELIKKHLIRISVKHKLLSYI